MSRIILIISLAIVSMALVPKRPGILKAAATAVEIRLQSKPHPVKMDGKSVIWYELWVRNNSRSTIHFETLKLYQNESPIRNVFLQSDNQELLKRIGRFEVGQHTGSQGDSLLKDEEKLVYREITLPGNKPSVRVSNEFEFMVDGTSAKMVFEFDVSDGKPVVLGKPLNGGAWAAVYNPFWERGHRRVVYGSVAQKFIPGRWAIDFVLLNEEGKFGRGDEDSVKNHFGYLSDVLAVDDAEVAAVRTDMSETRTVSAHPDYRPEDASGNFIVLKVADSVFVFYEHLRPGSIRVKTGDKVRAGQAIASLGFTGNSTGPHLHLHVADRLSLLNAESLPFVFDRFENLGIYNDFAKFGRSRWVNKTGGANFSRPAPNSVVRFN